ncbi:MULTISPECIES: HalOD1 output domain-containing protein [Haloarcula]|uniref:HalOD1 output domain-containing protein n=1 Tax=Haloarcula TaxID=2237 RepID=UPI0023E7AC28|nr:HalOD1 output domain-containing protein [Halomicroarcula sp. SHR3]
MADFQPEKEEGRESDDFGMIRRQIPPDPETAEYDLLEILAEVDGCEIEDLPALYNEVEHVVETLFRTPPSAAAQMSISFSYGGYRVTIDRNGAVTLVSVKESL